MFVQPFRYSIQIAQVLHDQVRRSQKGRSQIFLFFVRVIQGVGLPMVALDSFSLASPFSFVIALQILNEKCKRIESKNLCKNFN